jgi:hypothetical protein
MTGLGRALETNRTAQAAEVACVLLVAVVVISVGWRVVGSNLVARQAVVWIANILMLVTVWIGLRVRGQTWESIGLPFRFGGFRALGRTVLQAVIVLVFALAAFVAGSLVMVHVTPTPPQADMSGYTYLQGNLPMLLSALAGVYVVSSFGEGSALPRVPDQSTRSDRSPWQGVLAPCRHDQRRDLRPGAFRLGNRRGGADGVHGSCPRDCLPGDEAQPVGPGSGARRHGYDASRTDV